MFDAAARFMLRFEDSHLVLCASYRPCCQSSAFLNPGLRIVQKHALLDVQHGGVSVDDVKGRLAECVGEQSGVCSAKVNQLRVARDIGPLRPRNEGGDSCDGIGIEIVDEADVICHNGVRGDRRDQVVVIFKDIAGVEGAKDGRSVEVCAEIRPSRNGVGDLRKVDTTGEGEDDVAQDCGQTLELGIDFVQIARAERAAGKCIVGVGRNKIVDSCGRCRIGEVAVEVGD